MQLCNYIACLPISVLCDNRPCQCFHSSVWRWIVFVMLIPGAFSHFSRPSWSFHPRTVWRVIQFQQLSSMTLLALSIICKVALLYCCPNDTNSDHSQVAWPRSQLMPRMTLRELDCFCTKPDSRLSLSRRRCQGEGSWKLQLWFMKAPIYSYDRHLRDTVMPLIKWMIVVCEMSVLPHAQCDKLKRFISLKCQVSIIGKGVTSDLTLDFNSPENQAWPGRPAPYGYHNGSLITMNSWK